MEEAEAYLELATSYISQLEPFDGASIFLFEDAVEDTEAKNTELKEKATQAHKGFISTITNAIKNLISKVVNFVKKIFGFDNSTDSQAVKLEKVVDIVKEHSPQALNGMTFTVPNINKFIKEQDRIVNEIYKARRNGNYDQINGILDKFYKTTQNGAGETVTVDVYQAIAMLKSSGEASKRDVQKLRELERRISREINDLNNDNAAMNNAQLNGDNIEVKARMRFFDMSRSNILQMGKIIKDGLSLCIKKKKGQLRLNEETFDYAIGTLDSLFKNETAGRIADKALDVAAKGRSKYGNSGDLKDSVKNTIVAGARTAAAKAEYDYAVKNGTKKNIKAAKSRFDEAKRNAVSAGARAIRDAKDKGSTMAKSNALLKARSQKHSYNQ